MKKFIDYLFVVAIAVSIALIIWAWNESNKIRNHLIEQERIENILEERRNKIDSLKIIEVKLVEE